MLAIQVLEESLERIIVAEVGFDLKREDLLEVISDWATNAIGA
jgi:hypothetical protein